MNETTYSSKFGPLIKEYVDYKMASGFKATTYSKLKDFDNWCLSHCPDVDRLDTDIVMGYSERRSTEASMSQKRRISSLRLFNQYLIDTGRSTCPVPNDINPAFVKHVPYIFDSEELHAFFDAVDHLEPDTYCPNRDIVLPVMLRLAYCCGLRPQEVRNILLSDVSFSNSTLLIRGAKSYRDRKIVMSQDMCLLLMKYVAVMSHRQTYSTYLFERPSGGPYRARWLSQNVGDCCRLANLKPHGNTSLRPYDFRHNFATSVIRKWHEEGRDIDNSMVVLSEYMGHKHLDDTMYYITLLPEMFSDWPQFDWATDEFDYVPEEDYWNE